MKSSLAVTAPVVVFPDSWSIVPASQPLKLVGKFAVVPPGSVHSSK